MMLRLAAALLIASGLLLPLSSCHRFMGPNHEEIHYVDDQGRPNIPKPHAVDKDVRPVEAYAKEHPLPADITLEKDYKYVFTGSSIRELSLWFCLVGFLWPLGWSVTIRWIKSDRIESWVDLLSPLLLFGTGFALAYKSAMGDHFEVGFWTTFAGIILYSVHSARAYRDRLGRRSPALNAFIKRVLIAGAFGLGPALPFWQVLGRFFQQ